MTANLLDYDLEGLALFCERLGEKRTKMELGGPEVQIRAGTIDDAVESEQEAFEKFSERWQEMRKVLLDN